jgi:hypothetical protein
MKTLDSKKWFVLFTKPRTEIKVSQRLSVLGIENYTPTRIVVRQWSDRKKKDTSDLIALYGVGEY